MIPPIRYLAQTAGATATGRTLWLAPDGCNGWSMTVKTGVVTGAFTFQKSNDPRARPDSGETSSAVWDDFTADVASQISNPAGGAVQFDVDVSDFRAHFLRMTYTHTSGTGAVDAYFSAHGN